MSHCGHAIRLDLLGWSVGESCDLLRSQVTPTHHVEWAQTNAGVQRGKQRPFFERVSRQLRFFGRLAILKFSTDYINTISGWYGTLLLK